MPTNGEKKPRKTQNSETQTMSQDGDFLGFRVMSSPVGLPAPMHLGLLLIFNFYKSA